MKIPVYRYTHFQPHPPGKKQFLKGCSDLNSGDLSCFEFLDEPTRYLHGGCYTRIKLFSNRIWWLMVIMISIYFQVYVSMDDTFPGLVLFLQSLGFSQQSLGEIFPTAVRGKCWSCTPTLWRRRRRCQGQCVDSKRPGRKKKGPFRGEVAKNNWNRDEHGAVFHGVSYVVKTSGKHHLKHVELQHSHTAAVCFILSISWIIFQCSSNYT